MTGESFSLTNFRGDSVAFDSTTGIYVYQHDGLGMPPVQRITQEGPFQHGATQLNARLQPRVVTLGLANLESDTLTWAARDALFAMLNDIDNALYLDATRPDGTTRRLDVRYLDSLTMPRAAQHDGFDRYVLQFIAHDPVWYEQAAEVVTLDIAAGGEGLELPMEIPFGLGGSVVDSSTWFTYAGNWVSYPIIKLTGPIEDALLYTWVRDGDPYIKLSFDGVTIAAGDYYEIDCRYGYKTVKDSAGTNKIGDLTSDSDLAEFGIYPYPQCSVAAFVLTGIGATAATTCALTYYNRYVGF